jgi:hypothetical protein
MASALQQQPQLWISLEGPLRLHGWLMQQQQEQLGSGRALQQVSQCLSTGMLPSLVAQQQQLTPPLLLMRLSLCKLAQPYGTSRPGAAVAFASAMVGVLVQDFRRLQQEAAAVDVCCHGARAAHPCMGAAASRWQQQQQQQQQRQQGQQH